MLCFWNVAGVPFMYCFQSLYILKNHGDPSLQLPLWGYAGIYALLLAAYYVFDTANGQKANFKLPYNRPGVFPNFKYCHLEHPNVLKTPQGDLLVDGWYKYMRKAQCKNRPPLLVLMAGVGGVRGWPADLFSSSPCLQTRQTSPWRCAGVWPVVSAAWRPTFTSPSSL
jgi:hypothetical protein